MKKVTKFFKDKKNIILIAIIILAIFLIFFRLTRADIKTDGAHYSLRAIGYIDYLLSQLQTTPLQWFGVVPWWGWLSFHDHPPLVFLIQHFFFLIFGVSDFSALLPFALAGLGSVILLYLIGRELKNQSLGLTAALILTVSTFFIWSARINFLEAIVTLFILLAVLFFLKALKNDKYFLLFGLFLGLAFLTKYTTFFLVPLVVLTILIHDKKTFVNKRFLLGTGITLVVFLPVVIYNLMMYSTRGHFDIQFSTIFPFTFSAAQQDWPILFKEKSNFDFKANFWQIWRVLKASYSLPFYSLICLSLSYLIAQLTVRFKRLKEWRYLLLTLAIISLILMFIFISPSSRYLPIFSPFLALAVAAFILDLAKIFKKRLGRYTKYLMAVLILPILSFEVFYNINTNLLARPLGIKATHYSTLRMEDLGFRQLDKRLQAQFSQQSYYNPKIKNISEKRDISLSLNDTRDKDIFIYASNLNWFATVWYFQRHPLYHNIYFISDLDLAGVLGLEDNWFEFFYKQGVRDIYFIQGVDPGVFGKIDSDRKKLSDSLEAVFKENLEAGRAGEVFEVKNDLGEVAFRVYRLQLN